MCGLVALCSPQIPIRQDLLSAMRDRLTHRGPDNGGNWIEHGERLGFGHRRLSIMDTTHAADQPMIGDGGKFSLVFNGEIYNFIELRSELRLLGHTFRTNSDTEVLFFALIEWGEAALNKLNGMFAFVFWNGYAETLLVGRDRFGEKPLFLAKGQCGIRVFGSEMKALLAHPLISPKINDEAIAAFAQGNWYEDGEMTFFDNIERFPPAHAAIYNKAGIEIKRWRYWTPDYTKIDYSLSPREAAERFWTLFERSVQVRRRADVPNGSSLSGGLDSSAIVSVLAREQTADFGSSSVFSAVFPHDATMSEEVEIDEVAAYTKVIPKKVTPNPNKLVEEMSLLHWHQEEPFLSASIYLQWCVARLAYQNNTTVLLDGQGADELLAGYQFYFKQRQLDLLDRGEKPLALRETAKFNRRLNKASQNYVGVERRFNVNVAYSNDELKGLKTGGNDVFHYPYSVGTAPAKPGFRLRRTISEALLYNSLPMLLRYADRNSMAFSREVRLPFLDYELVDYCISMPDDYLIRNGWQKWILRQSVGHSIPSKIRWRADKVGYAAPLDTWLRKELRDWAHERLFDSSMLSLPFFDQQEIEKLWAQHQNEVANNSWLLWRWISLAEWLHITRSGWWKAGASVA